MHNVYVKEIIANHKLSELLINFFSKVNDFQNPFKHFMTASNLYELTMTLLCYAWPPAIMWELIVKRILRTIFPSKSCPAKGLQ